MTVHAVRFISFLTFVYVATLLASGVVAARSDMLTLKTASGSHEFTVEVVDTPKKRAVGLMYRTEMAADHGMLFDFKASRLVQFWMKNTYISLDMIFIREDGTIVRIARRTEPRSLRQISSGERVRFVLEVVAGTAERIGLRPGDRAIHPLITQSR